MKIYFSFLLVVLSCLQGVWGQIKLQNYEYWFDDDYANKTLVTITPTTHLNTNLAIPTNSLSAGLHAFHIRFQDDSLKYSTHLTQDFYSFLITNEITEYEYWFDGNYGAKVSQTISPTTNLQLSVPINVATLTPGIHTFKIRFAQGGIWSIIKESYCYTFAPTNNITAYEYWFDDNYSGKVSQTVSPNTTLNLTSSINVDTLTGGLHTFHIRFNQGGVWTTVKQSYFYRLGQSGTANNVITEYRYWFDNQTSNITTVPLNSPSSNIFLNDSVSVTNQDTGFHKIHLQMKDISGNWSSVFFKKFRKMGTPRLTSITPNKGGNDGDISTYIYGDGFIYGTTIKLTKNGQPDIVIPSNSIKFLYGSIMRATIDLHTPVTLGLWNLVVEIPNDTIMTLYNAFMVEPKLPTKIVAYPVGPTFLASSIWETYSVIYENIGNTDAKAVPLYICVDANVQLEFISSFSMYDSLQHKIIHYDSLSEVVYIDSLFDYPYNAKIYAVLILNAAPGVSERIDFRIRRVGSNPFHIKTWTEPNIYGSPQRPYLAECIDQEALFLLGNLPGIGCTFSAINGIIGLAIMATDNTDDKLSDYGLSIASTVISCIPFGGLARNIIKMGNVGYSGYQLFNMGCQNAYYPDPDIEEELILIPPVSPTDPNGKLGMQGHGSLNYFNGTSKIPYIIKFENIDTATAPAKIVIIRDTLNTNVYDMNTFELRAISIADTLISIPPKQKNFSMDVDLRSQGVYVACHINANVNVNTGVATWTFTAVDPLDYSAITDPLEGFLFPNITPPQGEGSVSYAVNLKPNLPLNTSIDNDASIYFDTNAPIVTNNWHNTLDNVKPVSSVLSAPALIPDSTYLVSWSGSDMSSGILSYNIYYATNGGAYKIWKLNTTAVSDTFVGRKDSIYCFYSVAKDTALNREDKPLVPDICTTLQQPLPIDLVSLVAIPIDNKYIKIDWATRSELNLHHFEVERGLDGIHFDHLVGSVPTKAIGGNSNSRLDYTQNDKDVNPDIQYYYRIKSIDVNGKYAHSEVVRGILFQGNTYINKVYPNPTSGDIEVEITSATATTYKFSIFNSITQEIYTKEMDTDAGSKNIHLNIGKLAAGIYELQISEQGKYLTTVKLVKF